TVSRARRECAAGCHTPPVKRHLVCKPWTIEKADENSNDTPWFALLVHSEITLPSRPAPLTATQCGKGGGDRCRWKSWLSAALPSRFPVLHSVSCARSWGKTILKSAGECDVPSERRCWS